jgi:hypothetical protein
MSNLIEYAKREFLKLGYKPIAECDDDPDKWIQENVLELLEVFSKQGHSGSSAPYAINMFKKLANFEPLAPIMCSDDEWNTDDLSITMPPPSNESYQNNRCYSIFKNGKDGKPYYGDAIVWKNQNGNTFTGSAFNSKRERIKSSQIIKKIPFYPKTFYIDVIEQEIAPDDFESFIKDETQLKKVWKYYEHQETPSYIRFLKLKTIKELNDTIYNISE